MNKQGPDRGDSITVRFSAGEADRLIRILNWCQTSTRSTDEERLIMDKILHKIRKSRSNI